MKQLKKTNFFLALFVTEELKAKNIFLCLAWKLLALRRSCEGVEFSETIKLPQSKLPSNYKPVSRLIYCCSKTAKSALLMQRKVPPSSL